MIIIKPIVNKILKDGTTKKTACKHKVSFLADYTRRWRKDIYTDQKKEKIGKYGKLDTFDQCTLAATVTVDGVPMCRRHAAYVALDYVMEQSEEKPDDNRK